jgi:hypothetical protein
VWTSDYPIHRYYCQSFVSLYEFQYLLDYLFIESQVFLVGMPSLQGVGFGPFLIDNANRHLGSFLVIGAVESDGGDGIATEASTGFLGQWVWLTTLDFHVAILL